MTETTASSFQSLPDDSIDLVAETVGYIQDHTEAKVTFIYFINSYSSLRFVTYQYNSMNIIISPRCKTAVISLTSMSMFVYVCGIVALK